MAYYALKDFLMQNLTTGDVDYYIWDWQDGLYDTVLYKRQYSSFLQNQRRRHLWGF